MVEALSSTSTVSATTAVADNNSETISKKVGDSARASFGKLNDGVTTAATRVGGFVTGMLDMLAPPPASSTTEEPAKSAQSSSSGKPSSLTPSKESVAVSKVQKVTERVAPFNKSLQKESPSSVIFPTTPFAYHSLRSHGVTSIFHRGEDLNWPNFFYHMQPENKKLSTEEWLSQMFYILRNTFFDHKNTLFFNPSYFSCFTNTAYSSKESAQRIPVRLQFVLEIESRYDGFNRTVMSIKENPNASPIIKMQWNFQNAQPNSYRVQIETFNEKAANLYEQYLHKSLFRNDPVFELPEMHPEDGTTNLIVTPSKA